MAEVATKQHHHHSINGGGLHNNVSEIIRTRWTVFAFAYAFMFAFVGLTIIVAFFITSFSTNSPSPWLTDIFTTASYSYSNNTTTPNSDADTYRSQFSSFFTFIFPNTSSPQQFHSIGSDQPNSLSSNQTTPTHNQISPAEKPPVKSSAQITKTRTVNVSVITTSPATSIDYGKEEEKSGVAPTNSTVLNHTDSRGKKQSNVVDSLMECNLFDGAWVRDDSYPLYKDGSCSWIDEQFNCGRNGRPDQDYQKLKWKPNACTLPRLDGRHMLDMIRGKRVVFVGDSLNRNMWESLVCMLRNSVKDPNRVFEAQGRQYFKGEASYSFIFKDYNCTIEFFVSPFLVREWEFRDKNGLKMETLRLDLLGKSSSQYKHADIIVFNTGHWWTHEKTSTGKNYYQEGSHVYGELNVLEAFQRALTTWARWVDKNVNPEKSIVFFRGYSASHFSGGQWNSGGQCDSETLPITNETYLNPYPPKMSVLENVLRGMKTQVTYLNITRMTDFRKDGHPSIYRKMKISEAERRFPLRFQDCSHWCLPGVPDAWNEILYAELLIRQAKDSIGRSY